MGLFGSKTSNNDKAVVEVHTNKRAYSWFGPKQVTWEKGEKVKSAEPKGFWGRK